MHLNRTVALVTGGAHGVGRATCEALAESGARVVVGDIDRREGLAVARTVRGMFVAADVSRLEDNHAMIAAAMDRFGQLDFLCLSAGQTSGAGVSGRSRPARSRVATGVNLDAVMFGTLAAMAAFEAGGRGGSIVATGPLPGGAEIRENPFHAASLYALVSLTRSLGPSLAAYGVRFNAVFADLVESLPDPTAVLTADANVSDVAAEEAAQAVLRLFCGEMTGQCLVTAAGRPAVAIDLHEPRQPEHPPAPMADDSTSQ